MLGSSIGWRERLCDCVCVYFYKHVCGVLVAQLECVCVLLICVPFFATPWTVACQVLLSMEFSRQEYWNGLSFPSPGNLPDLGIKLRSPVLQAVSCIAGRFFTNEPPGKPQLSIISPKLISALETQREEEEEEYSNREVHVPLVSGFGGPGWMGQC